MMPLSSVNFLVKTLCSNSALIDESLIIVPLLFFKAPIADIYIYIYIDRERERGRGVRTLILAIIYKKALLSVFSLKRLYHNGPEVN